MATTTDSVQTQLRADLTSAVAAGDAGGDVERPLAPTTEVPR